ncbi:hypothetical protein [Rhodococcus sp. IEGM 1307]|uniref:hypothetical protein n=1 Tax=Rhodococcus sp. IEGM 1307 TaxID=3047091 RepID=UPI0024B71CAF|nr:hypothetical protein [Rhodococcus sp. IEGM 1307]MDI9978748.1 hypothetical protein [Rhodococcus sp. IEGM 1307]
MLYLAGLAYGIRGVIVAIVSEHHINRAVSRRGHDPSMIEVAQENEVVIVQDRLTLTDGDMKGLAGCVERTIVGPVVTDLICGTPAFRRLVWGADPCALVGPGIVPPRRFVAR